MSEQNDPAERVRGAIRRLREEGDSGPDFEIAMEAAGHYADLAALLDLMFGPDVSETLQVEVGNAVQQHIEHAVTRGGVHSVQELGRVALEPVVARAGAVQR